MLKYTNEKLLQFLVAVVDAELLKTVLIKNFKSVNVQDANDGGFVLDLGLLVLEVDGLVDFFDDPREQPVVNSLGKSVPAVVGRRLGVRLGHNLPLGCDHPLAQGFFQFLLGDMQQASDFVDQCRVVQRHGLIVRTEFQISLKSKLFLVFKGEKKLL
jgi:hypothetical protein